MEHGDARAGTAANRGHVDSPIQVYLERLHTHLRSPDRRPGGHLHPRARARPTRAGSASASPPPTATSTRSATRRAAVHDPVDLEAVHLRPRARGPRPRGGAGEDRRRADGRRVQLDQPGAGHRPPAQPDDQRRRDRRRPRWSPGHSADDRLAAPAGGVLDSTPGAPLAIDEPVYESERDTGHRNRAIGHMLRNFDILDRATRSRRSTSTSSSARSRSTAAT